MESSTRVAHPFGEYLGRYIDEIYIATKERYTKTDTIQLPFLG
jgi:hypothetical protein